jgi:hypothetical protein
MASQTVSQSLFEAVVVGNYAYISFIDANYTQYTVFMHDINGVVGSSSNGMNNPVTTYLKSDDSAANPITSMALFTDGTNLTAAWDQKYTASGSTFNYHINYQTFLISNLSQITSIIDGGGAESSNAALSNRQILNIAGAYTPQVTNRFVIMFTIAGSTIVNTNNVIYTTETAIAGFVGTATGSSSSNPFCINQNCFLTTKFFLYNNDLFCLVSNTSELQPSYFLLGWDSSSTSFGNPSVYARNLYGQAGDSPRPHLQSVQTLNNTTVNFAVIKNTLLNTVSGTSQISQNIFRLKLNFEKRVKFVSSSKDLLIAGAKPVLYDGASFSEAGFNSYPENISITPDWLLVDTMNQLWKSLNTDCVVSSTPGVDGAANLFSFTLGGTAAAYVSVFEKSVVPESIGGIEDSLGANQSKKYAPYYDKIYIHHNSDRPFTLYFCDVFDPNSPDTHTSLYTDGISGHGGILVTPGVYEYDFVYQGSNPNAPTGVNYVVMDTTSVGSGESLSFNIDHILVYKNGTLIPDDQTNTGLDNGIYTYKVIYEITDNAGVIYQSAASVSQRICTTAWDWAIDLNQLSVSSWKSSVYLNVPYYKLSEKIVSVKTKIYRTIANGTADVYYLVNPENLTLTPNTLDGGASGYFIDTLNDINASENEILYSSGGILENDVMPCLKDVCLYKNRVVGIDAENDWIVYSKNLFQGSQISIPSEFTIQIAGNGLQCVSPMDDKLIVFKSTQMYLIYGDGADDTGNGSFSEPQLISDIIGCSNPKSIVITSDGLMFMSNKGYYLLDKSLNLTYIGAGVEKYNLNDITSSNCEFSKNQVIFTSSNGPALVFDLYFKQWSVYTNYNAIDAVSWLNTMVIGLPTGELKQESAGIFSDDGFPIKLKIITGWLNLASIQGFQNIYKSLLLGCWKSQHNLLITPAYNFIETFDISNQKIWTPSSQIVAKTIAYQTDIRLSKHSCESIKIWIEDDISMAESGLFTSAGAMNTPRYFHTSTVLQNGNVLISGGKDTAGDFLSSLELYNPISKTYTQIGNMTYQRVQHTATLLADGTVIFVGGQNGSGGVAVNELFNPTNNSVTEVSAIAIPRYGHTANLLSNGKILIVGGDGSASGLDAKEYVDLLSPLLGSNLIQSNYKHYTDFTSTTLSNGNILIAGGSTDIAAQTSAVEIYNPTSGTFSFISGSLNEAREGHQSVLLNDGTVLIMGGYSGGFSLNSCEIYDPSSNSCVQANSLIVPRGSFTANVLQNGKVIVIGGRDNVSGGANTILSSSELYDLSTKSFTLSGSLNTARQLQDSVLLMSGIVLILGGSSGSTAISPSEQYGYSIVGTGEGFNISNLAIEVGIKKGMFKTSIRG